mmetsp:Transcript_24003/g.61274  ORF Transcript_24003/g.61274 Transcript_24003/m.61274 type:complete len:233 (-) Transcript_24003:991-1689(-)
MVHLTGVQIKDASTIPVSCISAFASACHPRPASMCDPELQKACAHGMGTHARTTGRLPHTPADLTFGRCPSSARATRRKHRARHRRCNYRACTLAARDRGSLLVKQCASLLGAAWPGGPRCTLLSLSDGAAWRLPAKALQRRFRRWPTGSRSSTACRFGPLAPRKGCRSPHRSDRAGCSASTLVAPQTPGTRTPRPQDLAGTPSRLRGWSLVRRRGSSLRERPALARQQAAR